MEYDKIKQVVDVVSDNISEDQELDTSIIDDYREKFKNLKLNLRTRKKIAKELDLGEKTALNWKTVGDIFAFIDSSTLAKEHPREASRILKLVAGIISVFIPVILPVTGIIIALPQKTAASLMEWLGKPTPEHVIHKFADYQAEIARNKLIDNIQNTDDNEEKVVIIEQLN